MKSDSIKPAWAVAMDKNNKSQFKEIDKRFEQIDKRFEQIDKRFDSMEKRFDKKLKDLEKSLIHLIDRKIDEKLQTVKPYWVDKMMELLDKAAGNYKEVSEEQTILSGRQSTHSNQIEKLETRVSKVETHLHLPVVA